MMFVLIFLRGYPNVLDLAMFHRSCVILVLVHLPS
jgi:hypothetical protein